MANQDDLQRWRANINEATQRIGEIGERLQAIYLSHEPITPDSRLRVGRLVEQYEKHRSIVAYYEACLATEKGDA